MSSMEAAETAVARTPRDHQRHGPPGPHELLPRGPPPPRPVSEQLPLRRATEARIDPADAQPEPSDSDSQPERRWPTLEGARVLGPRLPDGRFERSGSSEADGSGDIENDDPDEAVLRTAEATQAAPHGALPPLCWRQTVWSMCEKTSCSCTGSSSRIRTCSPVASLEAAWAAFAEGWPVRTGRESRTWLPASWKDDGAESGLNMSSAAHMSDGRATGDHSHTSLLGLTCYRLRAFWRPRSLSSVFFQPLPMLHPLGPSLRPKHPRAKVRRGTLNLTRKVSMPAGGRAARHHPPGFSSAPCRAQGVPTACSSKARHPNHPNPTPTSPHLSRAGPKSGTCLLALLTFQHITGTGGARVAPGSAPGVGLASAGKTRGEALPRDVPGGFPKHVKRAFRRARGRAARSLCGGTWYRGKWHDSSTLQALSKPGSRPVLPPLRVNRNPCVVLRPICVCFRGTLVFRGWSIRSFLLGLSTPSIPPTD